jgi:hypothetical protein
LSQDCSRRIKDALESGMVATPGIGTQKAEVGGGESQGPGQAGLHSETLSEKQKRMPVPQAVGFSQRLFLIASINNIKDSYHPRAMHSNYLGDGDQEDLGSKLAWAKV